VIQNDRTPKKFRQSDSAGHGEFQEKSLHKSDPGKGVNLHIFKMAASETFNVLLRLYGWLYTL